MTDLVPEMVVEGHGLGEHRVVSKLVRHLTLTGELWSRRVVCTPVRAVRTSRASLWAQNSSSRAPLRSSWSG